MLRLSDVTMRYRDAPAPILTGVDLTIPPGRVVPLLGGNGVGKTTLLKLICGLIAPTSGSITVGGHDVVTDAVAARTAIGVSMYPERSFYYRLTCRQNLRYYASLRSLFGAAARREVSRVLELADLTEQQEIAFMRLSLGQRKRLGLARSLLGEPRLVLLDEPTANLDEQSTQRLYAILSAVAAAGGSVLFSTHQMRDLVVAGHGFLRIRDGRLDQVHEKDAAAGPTRWVRVVGILDRADLAPLECRYRVRRLADGFSAAIPVDATLSSFIGRIAELGVEIEQVLDDRGPDGAVVGATVRGPGSPGVEASPPELEEAAR